MILFSNSTYRAVGNESTNKIDVLMQVDGYPVAEVVTRKSDGRYMVRDDMMCYPAADTVGEAVEAFDSFQ